jgi:biopolymer transport protein ExbD
VVIKISDDSLELVTDDPFVVVLVVVLVNVVMIDVDWALVALLTDEEVPPQQPANTNIVAVNKANSYFTNTLDLKPFIGNPPF